MMFQKKAQINIIQIGKKLLTKHAKGSYEVKYQLPQACNFIKKETLAQMFSCEFCETSENIIFIEHLWWLLLNWWKNNELSRYLNLELKISL